MPGVVIHSWLALEILDRWQQTGDAPFPVGDPRCREGFLGGSMAPDMGLFPGGQRLISDLAHNVSSGDLTRTLLQTARTDVEKAFAWAWFSHVLADVILHPVINRGAASLRGLDASLGLTPYEDARAHRLVEMGLDAYWSARHPCSRERRFLPVFAAEDVGYLARVLGQTYGLLVSDQEIARSLQSCARYNRMLYLLGRIHGARLAGQAVPGDCLHHYLFRYLPIRVATGLFRRGCTAYELTHSVAPEPWLLAEVEGALEEYFSRYLQGYQSQLAELPNYNLHLGREEAEAREYPAAKRTREKLEDRLRRDDAQVDSKRRSRPVPSPPQRQA